MKKLVPSPQQTLALFRQHRTDFVSPELAKVREWIKTLDSPSFLHRQKATQNLQKMREFIGPALRQALNSKASPGKQQRLEILLSQEPRFSSPQLLRLQRALQILEWMGDTEARRFLQEVTKSELETVVAEQARQISARLERMEKK